MESGATDSEGRMLAPGSGGGGTSGRGSLGLGGSGIGGGGGGGGLMVGGLKVETCLSGQERACVSRPDLVKKY